MSVERYKAAADLAAAIDSMRVLRQCEVATGRPFVTGTDQARIKDAGMRLRRAR